MSVSVCERASLREHYCGIFPEQESNHHFITLSVNVLCCSNTVKRVDFFIHTIKGLLIKCLTVLRNYVLIFNPTTLTKDRLILFASDKQGSVWIKLQTGFCSFFVQRTFEQVVRLSERTALTLGVAVTAVSITCQYGTTVTAAPAQLQQKNKETQRGKNLVKVATGFKKALVFSFVEE